MLLYLLLLFLLLHNGQAYDGCQGMYGELYWRCGDVCTYPKRCICGGETFGLNDGKWCCATQCTGGGCLKWKQTPLWVRGRLTKDGNHPDYCAQWSPANCTVGVTLPLNEKCNGLCNEHPSDKYRNWSRSRSYLAVCPNTSTCYKEGERNTSGVPYTQTRYVPYTQTICTGNSSCEGELAWCQKDERTNEVCPDGFFRCSPTLGGSKKKDDRNGTNGIPGQCIRATSTQDGRFYHCLDRSDENPFQEAGNSTNQQHIDFARLRSCHDKRGRTYGLECGGKLRFNCKDIWNWCRGNSIKERCPVLGAGIFTNTPRVCQEYKFWQDKPCRHNFIRCKAGYSGQCVSKEYWGIEGAKYDGSEASCKDGSDLYRPIIAKAGEPSSLPRIEDEQSGDGEYSDNEDYNNFVKEEELSTPQVWKTEPVDDYDFNAKGEEERAKYRRDPSTKMWMFAVTEETCEANDGFVCKVRLGNIDVTSLMMLMKSEIHSY